MKNLLLILTILVCSSAYSQIVVPDTIVSDTSMIQQTEFLKKHGVYGDFVNAFYSDTIKEVQVDTTNGIKTRVVNNKVYYIRETQKITIKHEEKD